MAGRRAYWFPAKRYGWGWGLPTAWQGWAVLAGFLALVAAGGFVVFPRYGTAAFTAYSVAISLGLVLVCWLTGEPPVWRWGRR